MLLHSYIVARGEGKQTVAAFLRTKLNLPWSKAKELVVKKQVRVAGQPTADPAQRLKVGNRVEVHGFSPIAQHPQPATRKSKVVKDKPMYDGPMPEVIYEDNAVVVVNKPAGLTTMRHADEAAEFGERGKRFLPVTLADLLPSLLGQPDKPLRAVHRIDRDTSGLVVFARTAKAERDLLKQFREHTVERRYLALVRGTPKSGKIESKLVRDRGDGRRGSSAEGQRAVTHVKIVEGLGNYTLVECRLETGRTHQVRIHLGEHGTPLCGEGIYDRPLNGKPHPDASGAKRPLLHAAKLGFHHPETEEKMSWSCPVDADMAVLIEELRADDFRT
jgi:23S rRNA pseudouridine1911/1915/1917 synthase